MANIAPGVLAGPTPVAVTPVPITVPNQSVQDVFDLVGIRFFVMVRHGLVHSDKGIDRPLLPQKADGILLGYGHGSSL